MKAREEKGCGRERGEGEKQRMMEGGKVKRWWRDLKGGVEVKEY